MIEHIFYLFVGLVVLLAVISVGLLGASIFSYVCEKWGDAIIQWVPIFGLLLVFSIMAYAIGREILGGIF